MTSTPMADSPLYRAAQVLHAFSDMQPGQTIAATANAAGGADHFTYGDLRALVDGLTQAHEQLARIASWHSRETAEGGMVGSYCVECGHVWPCDTRRMAEGTYVDEPDA